MTIFQQANEEVTSNGLSIETALAMKERLEELVADPESSEAFRERVEADKAAHRGVFALDPQPIDL